MGFGKIHFAEFVDEVHAVVDDGRTHFLPPFQRAEGGVKAAEAAGAHCGAHVADNLDRRLAELDLLNTWTTPIGSAVFAVLPGALAGESLGEKLFA